MKLHTIMVCTASLSLGACSSYGGYSLSGARFTPRQEIAQADYTDENRTEDYMDSVSYNKYEERELCQHYRKPPRNFEDGCVSNLAQSEVIAVQEEQPVSENKLLPIVKSYTVLFNFDKSEIRSGEVATLDQAMRDITEYNPTQVTVAGYTDSMGSDEYNMNLSRQRERVVSAALIERGIANQVINREARGEDDQAVETKDGVKNQENRRVVIDFRRQN